MGKALSGELSCPCDRSFYGHHTVVDTIRSEDKIADLDLFYLFMCTKNFGSTALFGFNGTAQTSKTFGVI